MCWRPYIRKERKQPSQETFGGVRCSPTAGFLCPSSCPQSEPHRAPTGAKVTDSVETSGVAAVTASSDAEVDIAAR